MGSAGSARYGQRADSVPRPSARPRRPPDFCLLATALSGGDDRAREALAIQFLPHRAEADDPQSGARETALLASEEKYRNSIDHAPDPMYEIDPATLEVLSVNSAAHELHDRLPYEHQVPLVGMRLPDLTPPQLHPLVYKHIDTVRANGSDQALDLELRGHYFDVN